MKAFYNEIDPYAAQWLRNLIKAGHIANGVVDERDIRDIQPGELDGYTQCHFFAGIGGWSYALRLAGWPDDRPVWTGSCPCQPFSAAGKRGGHEDERHLWPTWERLIRECRPECIFGEQVASADSLAWLDVVCTDMEAEGYAIGAVDLCAAGVGAPHIRQRLWFVADACARGLRIKRRAGSNGNPQHLAHADERSTASELGNTASAGLQAERAAREFESGDADSAGVVGGFWSDAEWIACRDGKARPVEPGTFPLAHGATARVGRLRAYGNAIVPQVAAGFIGAYLDREFEVAA